MNNLLAKLRSRMKKRLAYRKAEKAWNNQFPPLSCHPPYVSPEELEELERILDRRKQNRKAIQLQTASEL